MTDRAAIAGVEPLWASEAALHLCEHCGLSHAADWIHVPAHCRRPPQRRPKRKPKPAATKAPSVDPELRAAVLAVLREHGPFESANRVVAKVSRQRSPALAALRELEAAGLARRNGRGWEAVR